MPKRVSPLLKSARSAANNKVSDKKDKPSKPASGAPSWLTKGRDNINANKPTGNKMVPEFFMGNGESAVIKILDRVEDLERSVGRHQYPARSKAGKKYFRAFTCSGDADSCAGCANGDRASQRWPLLVIDTRELKVRDRTTGKMVVRKGEVKLWLPSINELERFVGACEDFAEENGEVTGRVLCRVRRTGEKAQTAYSFTIKKAGAGLTPEEKAAVTAFTEEYGSLTDVLAPLTLAEQRKIVGAPAKGGDDEEEAADESDDDDDDDPSF